MNIEKYLLEKGFKANLKGFDYLFTAIKLCMEDKSLLRAVTTRLYPMIAEKYNDTASKTERAMRYSLIKAKIVETVSEFIAKAIIELKN